MININHQEEEISYIQKGDVSIFKEINSGVQIAQIINPLNDYSIGEDVFFGTLFYKIKRIIHNPQILETTYWVKKRGRVSLIRYKTTS